MKYVYDIFLMYKFHLIFQGTTYKNARTTSGTRVNACRNVAYFVRNFVSSTDYISWMEENTL